MKKKTGISLIVLVITIIVMIILAASVVITLSNTGVINKASEAVDKTNINEIQNYATLIWSDEYIAGKRDEQLKEDVLGKLEDYNDIYDIEVNNGGVTVKPKDPEKGNWKLVKTPNSMGTKVTAVKVTNGTLTLDVGTTVNYMTQGVGPEDAKYMSGWKVLGVDDKGRLLIMSNECITGRYLNFSGTAADFENALTTIQNTVDAYKEDTYASSIRSVKVEDIDALVNYDKRNYEKGTIYEYGLKVSFEWDGTGYPKYSYGATTGNLSLANANHSSTGFLYYDAAANKVILAPYTSTAGTKIATIENNIYTYVGADYMEQSIPAYSMIFDSSTYFLANKFTSAGIEVPYYGLFAMNGARVDNGVTFSSFGYSNNYMSYNGNYVRAVVTLKNNVVLTESEITPGTYDVTIAE